MCYSPRMETKKQKYKTKASLFIWKQDPIMYLGNQELALGEGSSENKMVVVSLVNLS